MSVQTITERELAANGVSSLPLTPTASPALGGRDYTPAEVKAAFDRLPRLIAARLNALLTAVTDGALLADIPVAFGEASLSLSDLLALLTEHLQHPPVSDSAPTSESENTVTSGGVHTALGALRDEVLMTASSIISTAIGAQSLTYDAETGALALAPSLAGASFTTAALPLPALSETVALLRTLMGASVLSETVEDTYSARVTAGGLPVVDEAPTTVHRIVGATRATVNLLDESIFMPLTISATGYAKNIPFTIAAGTYTVSTGLTDGSVVDNALAIILQNSDGETIVDCNAGSGNKAGASNTFTVTEEKAQRITTFRIFFNAAAAGKTVAYFMLNEGSTALPHDPYFAGLKNATFRGITSTGRNLLRELRTAPETKNGITLTCDAAAGTVHLTGELTAGNYANFDVTGRFYLPAGTYTLYIPNKHGHVNWFVCNKAGKNIGVVYGNAAGNHATFTLTEAGQYLLRNFVLTSLSGAIGYTETPMILPGAVTEDFPAPELYRADTSFALASPVTLGRWDTIDVDAGKRIVGTVTETSETPYGEEQLAQYGEYILSADGKTIAYPAATPTEETLTMPTKTYKAWRGGCEYVMDDTLCLPLTVTGDYYVKAGGEEA